MPTEQELLDAIGSGDEEGACGLVEAEPQLAEARGSDGVSALMLALYRGQDRAVQALRRAKPDLDVFEAAALGDAERLRQLLVADPELVHSWTDDGFTPLHYAAFFDGPEAAELLLEGGADARAFARHEQLQVEPIHSAAAARQPEIVRLLLEHGADPDARQGGGSTPLHAAAQNGDEETARLLLDAGADSSLAHPDGRTAADFAREAGHEQLAARLAEPG